VLFRAFVTVIELADVKKKIPACAGMTAVGAGMTAVGAGMTAVGAGMTD
jgi:hypothetical protein